MLRAIDSTARGALDARRPLSVCGEMAGDPQAAVLLMGLGVETLSMAAASIPAVKLALRTFSRQQAQAMAVLALAAEDPLEVRQMLNAAFDAAGLKSPAAESEVR
ncbi:MAG: putative PEP-binding protein [Rubrivivax sp.]|nr:putative PEP-binding protein [Rubrivivax sp.]